MTRGDRHDRDLTLDLVRVTQAAAVAAARHVGAGDPEAADAAAVQAMRSLLATLDIDGVVTVGEGEMDRAPMLFIGERVGTGQGPSLDVAVDPIDGTDRVAQNLPGAISALAVAPRGSLLHAPDMYMEKLAVGRPAAGLVSLAASPAETVAAVARALSKPVAEVTVAVLDRPRHAALVEALRHSGASVRLIAGGDVLAAIATGLPTAGVDLLLGTGGAPEGVLAAAALRCLGGDFQARLSPADGREEARAGRMLADRPRRLLTLDRLVGRGDVLFTATGITDGALLHGVRRIVGEVRTHSLATRASTRTACWVDSVHPADGWI